MLNKPSFIAIIVALAIVFSMCKKDFIVEDISNKSVTVNSPEDSLVTTSNLLTFWWEPVDGAEKYNMQLVKGSFKSVSEFVYDTNTTATRIILGVHPGEYEWRIKAVNAGSETIYKTFKLIVDTTSDLRNLVVNRISPVNGYISASRTLGFYWEKLSVAKTYQLQINNGLTLDTIISKNNLTVTLPASTGSVTIFSWRVKALNENSSTNYAAEAFTFTVDLKPPSAPSLISPAHYANIRDTTRLLWFRNNPSDIATDSVYISTDSTFQNVISQSAASSGIRVGALNNPPPPNNLYYWWRVRSFDEAGNRSNSSAHYRFRLIP